MNPSRLLRWMVASAVLGAFALVVAGRLDLPRVWTWLSVFWGMTLVSLLFIPEELMRERLRPGQKTADPLALALLRLTTLAHIMVSLLDVGRFHWSDTVPAWLLGAGVALMTGALAFMFFAVSVNRFFVPQLRIQSDRGHALVDRGPYALVRHPGYAGAALFSLASPLALGSWIGAACGLAALGVFAYRAAGEDRFLHANLPGYPEYASRVRYRLLPGVW